MAFPHRGVLLPKLQDRLHQLWRPRGLPHPARPARALLQGRQVSGLKPLPPAVQRGPAHPKCAANQFRIPALPPKAQGSKTIPALGGQPTTCIQGPPLSWPLALYSLPKEMSHIYLNLYSLDAWAGVGGPCLRRRHWQTSRQWHTFLKRQPTPLTDTPVLPPSVIPSDRHDLSKRRRPQRSEGSRRGPNRWAIFVRYNPKRDSSSGPEGPSLGMTEPCGYRLDLPLWMSSRATA